MQHHSLPALEGCRFVCVVILSFVTVTAGNHPRPMEDTHALHPASLSFRWLSMHLVLLSLFICVGCVMLRLAPVAVPLGCFLFLFLF